MPTKYTITIDSVHVIKDNGKIIAMVYNNTEARTSEIYSVKKLTGSTLGDFLAELLQAPAIISPKEK